MKVAEARAAARERRAVAIQPSSAGFRPSIVVALARTETRKLLGHPAFLGALGLVGLAVGRGAIGGGPNSGGIVVVLFVGLLAATLMSANLAALRSRRDGTDELFGSTPSSPEHRTAAHLLSLAGPLLIALVLGAATFVARLDGRRMASIEPTLAVQSVLVVVAFGALGVALARWIPSVLAAPVAIVAHAVTPLVWLVPWVVIREWGVRLGWHFAFLGGAIVFFATMAFVRDRPAPARVGLAGVALVLAVLSAVLQFPPEGPL